MHVDIYVTGYCCSWSTYNMFNTYLPEDDHLRLKHAVVKIKIIACEWYFYNEGCVDSINLYYSQKSMQQFKFALKFWSLLNRYLSGS